MVTRYTSHAERRFHCISGIVHVGIVGEITEQMGHIILVKLTGRSHELLLLGKGLCDGAFHLHVLSIIGKVNNGVGLIMGLRSGGWRFEELLGGSAGRSLGLSRAFLLVWIKEMTYLLPLWVVGLLVLKVEAKAASVSVTFE